MIIFVISLLLLSTAACQDNTVVDSRYSLTGLIRGYGPSQPYSQFSPVVVPAPPSYFHLSTNSGDAGLGEAIAQTPAGKNLYV